MSGWSKYENRCFKFINERLTWEVAETLCQMSYGANLATIQTQDHQEWVSNLAGRKAYWIGTIKHIITDTFMMNINVHTAENHLRTVRVDFELVVSRSSVWTSKNFSIVRA